MKRKHIFYFAYLLLIICLVLVGAYALASYKDLAFSGGVNQNAYTAMIAISMIFPFIMGLLLAAEYVYSVVKKRKPIVYNWPRFWCITFPLFLLLVYLVLSRWGDSFGILLPPISIVGVNDPYGIIAFGFGYSIITNISSGNVG